jgi:hypothetical protein
MDEIRRMAEAGVTLDVMTMVLRMDFTDEQIAHGYTSLIAEGWNIAFDRVPYFIKH